MKKYLLLLLLGQSIVFNLFAQTVLKCPHDTIVPTNLTDCTAYIDYLDPPVTGPATPSYIIFDSAGNAVRSGNGTANYLVYPLGTSRINYYLNDGSRQSCTFKITVVEGGPLLQCRPDVRFCYDSISSFYIETPNLYNGCNNTTIPDVWLTISGAINRAPEKVKLHGTYIGYFPPGTSILNYFIIDATGKTVTSCKQNVIINAAVTASVNAKSSGTNQVTISAVAGGGTAPYKYSWSTGDSTSSITIPLPANTVTAPADTTPAATTTSTQRIEAENYTRMQGIVTEPTADTGAGLDVGYIDPQDFMEYGINIKTAGTYTIRLRIASPANNGQLQIQDQTNIVLATVNVPNTQGWQNWKTIETKVSLSAGSKTLRIVSTSPQWNGWNINWLELVTTSSASVPPVTTASIHTEAENYVSMRGIQTEKTSDSLGGLNVGYIDPADYMDYNINIPAAGSYTFSFRIATPANNAQLQVKGSDSSLLGTVNLPNTGGYQTWKTVTSVINLPQGNQTIRIVSTAPLWNSWNINWFNITSNATSNVTPTPPPVVSSPNTAPIQMIQAVNYSSMSGVIKEASNDPGSTVDVGYIDPGDYMDYAINIPYDGTYVFKFRINSPSPSCQFQIQKGDGSVLSVVNVPFSNYRVWITLKVNLALLKGPQTIRIFSTSPTYNAFALNWIQIVPPEKSNWPDYNVVVRDAFGCSTMSNWDGTLNSSAVNSVAKVLPEINRQVPADEKLRLNVYPNPSNNSFNLLVHSNSREQAKLIVWNLSGKIIEERIVNPDQLLQAGASYRPGMYYAELIQGNKKTTVKLVKLNN